MFLMLGSKSTNIEDAIARLNPLNQVYVFNQN